MSCDELLLDEQQKTSDEKWLKDRSRLLSRILRHRPHSVGLSLDRHGYVAVHELLQALQHTKFPMDKAMLDEVVAKNNKQRFSYSADGQKIRANQGHSVEVDLDLLPMTPPDVLYHGTAIAHLEGIWQLGLTAQKRHHVHLSVAVETAVKVGRRHGKAVVLKIDAKQMSADGFVFYVSDNGVWLTDHVPVDYLSCLDECHHA